MPHASALRFDRVPVRALLLLGCAAALGLGCGSSDHALTRVEPPAPPAVLATQPPARATGVLYDAPISVDFNTDMDSGTLNTSNVFLKLDTQRLPIQLSWDPGVRRLQVLPQTALRLRRTYTVEMTAGVRTAEGTDFGPTGWYFQFTTNSARRPTSARPLAGGPDESPFVMLSWDSTEAGIGSIGYEIWSGLDSAAVVVRAGTPTATVSRASWFPSAPWPFGERVFWAVTVVNGATGEHLDGPVHSFPVLPASTPIDSVLILGDDSGFNAINIAQSATTPIQTCSLDSIVSQVGTQAWIAFPLSSLPADVRIASARLEIETYDHYVSRLGIAAPLVWSAKYDWPRPCRSGLQFRESLPVRDLLMANGYQVSGRQIRYMSSQLAAHVEASVRRGGFFGYELSSSLRLAYATSRVSDPSRHPYLKIHYFRTAPAPLSSRTP